MATKKTGVVGTMAVTAAGVAAGAIGTYWLYGTKHAAKNRKAVRSWMLKARGDVMEAVEKLGDVNKETYQRVVDQVMKSYANSGVNTTELAQMVKDLKASWSHISQAHKKIKKAPVKKSSRAKK